jgi:hypothetical protein
MVGTHFAEDRDHFESAMQRMREAFTDLKDGRRSAAAAEDEFDQAYATVREIVWPLLQQQRQMAARRGQDDADLPA